MNQFIPRVSSIFAIFLLFTALVFGQLKPVASVEGITEYQLDNGLKVLLFPDNSSQTITVNITYLVGSRHEGYGEKGMAHLLEHMVFKGTPKHPNIPEELTSHGARPNGTTWYDRTNYFETFNATDENLEWALDLEADRMVNSYIAKKDLESEFSVVRNEFESGENSPSNVLMKNVTSSAFLWHNYGQSTIGNRSDIERVPIDNLKAFYKKYYRPENAVLMITGKIEPVKTLKLVQEKFGDIKNPETPISLNPTIEPPQDGEKRVVINRVGDLQVVSALYHTPAGSDEDYAAISVIEEVLTDQPAGRLYKALIDSQKASSVYAFSPFTKEPSFMYISASVPSDKSLDQAETTMLNLLDDLKNNPVTQEELNRAKSNLMKQYDQVFRNSSYLATYVSEFIGAGDWRLSFIHRDRIENLTLEKVNEAVKEYFKPTNRTVGLFIPTKQTPDRVAIGHVENLEDLVKDYKGKEGFGTGETFDVSFDNIKSRLETGLLPKTGIEYGLIEKENRGETVQVNFVFRNGNVDDLMNLGMADNYTANMLNKGTKNHSRQEIEDKLSALKSNIYFSGSNGRLYAYVTSTKENLKETLDLMVDMLKNPTFDADELQKLKIQNIAYIEQSKTEPSSVVMRRLGEINEHYPKGHPLYSMSVDEQLEAINNVSIEDLKNYYNNFYGISTNATLVAIGSFDGNELKSYVDDHLSDFKSTKKYTAISDPDKLNKGVNEQLKTPDKKNAYTRGLLNFEANQNSKDFPALQIASSIFGGGFLNSRIATRLRQQDGVSYGAGGFVSVDADADDSNSSVSVYAIYAPQNAEKVQAGFSEEINKFISEGITKEELENAKKGWIQQQNVSRAKDNELASLINNNLYYDRDLTFQEEVENKVMALTVEDVNKAIKKYFKPFSEWTVVNAGDFDNMIETPESEKKVD